VGFVLARAPLLAQLGAVLGPWSLSGPSRWVARGALSDRSWQEATRQDLRATGARLEALLSGYGLAPDGGCELFQWVRAPDALAIHETLARQGILTRYFASVPSLRFGLPGAEGEWERLEESLRELRLGEGVARIALMQEQQAQQAQDRRTHGAQGQDPHARDPATRDPAARDVVARDPVVRDPKHPEALS
jgi:hypothetical protein